MTYLGGGDPDPNEIDDKPRAWSLFVTLRMATVDKIAYWWRNR